MKSVSQRNLPTVSDQLSADDWACAFVSECYRIYDIWIRLHNSNIVNSLAGLHCKIHLMVILSLSVENDYMAYMLFIDLALLKTAGHLYARIILFCCTNLILVVHIC